MNVNYLIYNNLGILSQSDLKEVSQGNHNVDYYYVGYDTYDYTTGYLTISMTLPDGTSVPSLATSFKGFEFNGKNYKGYVFKLPQELTAIAGNLTMTLNLNSVENDTRLCSSRANVTIHASNVSAEPTITETQYYELIENMRLNFVELENRIIELENQLIEIETEKE